MFSLHETIQRRVCRIGFLACAVAPTLAVLCFVAYSVRPWREADWQRTLSQELHIRATIEHVASPTPGVMRLGGVQIADLLSGQPLGTVDRMDVRRQRGQLTLSANAMQLEAAQFGELAAAVVTWLASDETSAVELQIEQLQLLGPAQQSLTLADVRVRCDRGAGQTKRVGVQCGPLRLLVNATIARPP